MKLSDLLVQSAKAFPGRPAVQGQSKTWTYQRLHEYSDAIAGRLLGETGVQKQRVGIYMDKAPETVAAIFGVLKSGACYVPLDPMAPLERLKLIIRDCGLGIIITSIHKQDGLHQLVEDSSPVQMLIFADYDAQSELGFWPVRVLTLNPAENLPLEPISFPEYSESALAYILYTSGSTGQPKGVMIQHSAAYAFVQWAAASLRLSEADRFASHAPFHFDLSVFDIYAAILHGGCICLVPSALSIFPKSLADFIENESITVWYSVPSILIQLVLHGRLEQRRLDRLKHIIFAGEVFPTKYLSQLLLQVPGAKYYNWYGPTETNVCTYQAVSVAPPEDKTVPIGKPCTGQELYIVDEDQRPCAAGEKGELWVHGPTLMEGYWNDAEKTSRSLVDNPFSQTPQKIYKTGDMVSWNEAGELEYHGRIDHMIKSRGYRIEIGEIETVLNKHEEIHEAAVVGVQDEQVGKRIKAALVLRPDSRLTEPQIKHYCAQHLPAYMVPESIQVLACLPRTSTNKIDRKKLEQGQF
jgi:amino acid adenylation domain-containing protein